MCHVGVGRLELLRCADGHDGRTVTRTDGSANECSDFGANRQTDYNHNYNHNYKFICGCGCGCNCKYSYSAYATACTIAVHTRGHGVLSRRREENAKILLQLQRLQHD